MEAAEPGSVEIDEWLADYLEYDHALGDALEDARCRSDVLYFLVQARRHSGKSQTAVAAHMETTQSAVSDLEGGTTDPRLSTLQRYARAVGHALRVHVDSGLNYVPLPKSEFSHTAVQRAESLQLGVPTYIRTPYGSGSETVQELAVQKLAAL